MKKLIFVFIALSLLLPAKKRKHLEKYYQQWWASCRGGSITNRLSNGRKPDIIFGEYVIEVDFADKYPEALGQALQYSQMTKMKAGIVLIVEDMEKQGRCVKELEDIIWYHCLYGKVTVWVINATDDHIWEEDVVEGVP